MIANVCPCKWNGWAPSSRLFRIRSIVSDVWDVTVNCVMLEYSDGEESEACVLKRVAESSSGDHDVLENDERQNVKQASSHWLCGMQNDMSRNTHELKKDRWSPSLVYCIDTLNTTCLPSSKS